MRETAGNLGDVRSGHIDMRLSVRPQGLADAETGFALRGPFRLGVRSGDLPEARVAYTQVAGPRRAKVTLVAAANRAFVEVGGRAYRLPAQRARALRLGGTGGRGGGPAGRTGKELVRWIDGPRLERRGETDRITARVNVPEAVNGLLRLSSALGGEGGPAPLRGGAAAELRRAARTARAELITGHEDRLLRLLALDVNLGAGRGVRTALGPLRGARITFRLSVQRPNTPVRVAAPRAARPLLGALGRPLSSSVLRPSALGSPWDATPEPWADVRLLTDG